MTSFLPSLRILAVEDDPLQAHALRLHLLEMGYDPPFEASSAARAEELFAQHQPDLVLLDVHLHGGPDGIELAGRLRARRSVPMIFLTSAHDRSTFERAREASPHAFLTKPYDQEALHRAIELAAQHRSSPDEAAGSNANATPDHLWLRDGSRLVRAAVADIICVEADDSYSHLHTVAGRKFTVRQSLRELEESLPAALFLRVHRGYLVQATHIDSVDLPNNELTLGKHTVPLGRAYRDEVVRRLGL